MIVDVALLKTQLNWTDDMGDSDDELLLSKVKSAQQHIESLMGFKIDETYGGAGQEPVPEALSEAVLQLAAWWYVQREAAVAGVSVQSIPHGVDQIVQELRDWTF